MGLQVICRKRGIPMRVLLLVLVVLTWTPAVASAQANLCDPNWLERASSSEVRALLRGGADVNQICNDNRNRPLHQAILTGGVSPGVIRALVEAGADILAANLFGSSPLDYAEDRFARAERNFQPGSGRYRREETIYLAVNRGFEAGSAAADAHSQLCDLDWWRSSASGPAVEALLRTPGVDPNTVCNLSNDRPIHLPMKFTSFVLLTEGVARGIDALVDGNAALRVRNSSGDSPVDLAQDVGKVREQLAPRCQLPDRVVGSDGRERPATRPSTSRQGARAEDDAAPATQNQRPVDGSDSAEEADAQTRAASPNKAADTAPKRPGQASDEPASNGTTGADPTRPGGNGPGPG